MAGILALLRVAYQATGLALTLLAIPLAFDVGGVDCGISFTFLLSACYIILCTLRIALRRTYFRLIADLAYYSQVIMLPSMLLLHLSQYSSSNTVLANLITPWKLGLEYATGPFALLEGFCVLIIIQACGRLSTALVRKSDMFLLVLLVLASLMISADLYLLVRIYMFPDIVGATAATLIGAALSICLFLGVYGIWSRKGNVVESTLLVSYVVYQIYLTLTDFQPNGSSVGVTAGGPPGAASTGHPPSPLSYDRATSLLWSFFSEAPRDTNEPHHFVEPELPPVIIDSLTELMTQLAELTPTGLKKMLEFLVAVFRSITPSICVSLVVRLTSYFVAMRLVPYVKRQTFHRLSPQPRKISRLLLLAYSYSPVLIIMVYTHLLLQHTGHIVHSSSPTVLPFEFDKIWMNSRQAWQFWGWINVFWFLGLYAMELTMSAASENPGTPMASDDVMEL